MKVRTTTAGTVLSTKLTAAGFGVLAVFASVGLSACSGGSSSTTPAIFSPSVTGSATATGTASNGASDGAGSGSTPTAGSTPAAGSTPSSGSSGSVTVAPTITVTPSPSVTFSPAPTPTPSVSTFPTAAPSTGGGGTAGVQDVLLFGLGGGAIVAGAGSIAYRRKLNKHR